MTGLEKLVNIIGPMILGIALTRVFLKPLQNDSLSNREKLATMFETAALKILLPFFIIDSLMKTPISFDYLYVLLLGFFIPALVYSIWQIFNPLADRMHLRFRDLSFLSSTFGGGNRGNLFISILFVSSINYERLYTYFSLVDLGNLLFLITIMPWLLRKKYRKDLREPNNKIVKVETGDRKLLNRILSLVNKIVLSYPAVALMWVLSYFIATHLSLFDTDQIDAFLKQSVVIRKYLFMSLLFGSIYLRMDLNIKNITHFLPDLLAFAFSRFLAIIFIFVINYFLKMDSLLTTACIILLLMPPSSMLPLMISNETNDGDIKIYVNTSTITFNVVFVLLLIGGVIVLQVVR